MRLEHAPLGGDLEEKGDFTGEVCPGKGAVQVTYWGLTQELKCSWPVGQLVRLTGGPREARTLVMRNSGCFQNVG